MGNKKKPTLFTALGGYVAKKYPKLFNAAKKKWQNPHIGFYYGHMRWRGAARKAFKKCIGDNTTFKIRSVEVWDTSDPKWRNKKLWAFAPTNWKKIKGFQIK